MHLGPRPVAQEPLYGLSLFWALQMNMLSISARMTEGVVLAAHLHVTGLGLWNAEHRLAWLSQAHFETIWGLYFQSKSKSVEVPCLLMVLWSHCHHDYRH